MMYLTKSFPVTEITKIEQLSGLSLDKRLTVEQGRPLSEDECKAWGDLLEKYKPAIVWWTNHYLGASFARREKILKTAKIDDPRVYDYLLKSWMPRLNPEDVFSYVLSRMTHIPPKGETKGKSNISYAISRKRDAREPFRKHVKQWIQNAISDMAREAARSWLRTDRLSAPCDEDEDGNSATLEECRGLELINGSLKIAERSKQKASPLKRELQEHERRKYSELQELMRQQGLSEDRREHLTFIAGLLAQAAEEAIKSHRFNKVREMAADLLFTPWKTNEELGRKHSKSPQYIQSLRKGTKACKGIETILQEHWRNLAKQNIELMDGLDLMRDDLEMLFELWRCDFEALVLKGKKNAK